MKLYQLSLLIPVIAFFTSLFPMDQAMTHITPTGVAHSTIVPLPPALPVAPAVMHPGPAAASSASSAVVPLYPVMPPAMHPLPPVPPMMHPAMPPVMHHMHPMMHPLPPAPAGMYPVHHHAHAAPPAPVAHAKPELPDPDITPAFLKNVMTTENSRFMVKRTDETLEAKFLPATTQDMIHHYVFAAIRSQRSKFGERADSVMDALESPYPEMKEKAHITKLLHERMGVHQPYGDTYLHKLAATNNADGIKLILELQPHLLDVKRRYDNYTALHVAVIHNHKESVQVLLNNGANPNINTKDGSPLDFAVNFEYTEIIQMLLDKGADPTLKDADGRNPITVAIMNNNVHIFEMLTNKNFDINQPYRGKIKSPRLKLDMTFNDSSLLCVAAYCGSNAIVAKMLTIDGINSNMQSSLGNTACHLAAEGSPRCLRLLLSAGADFTIQNNENETPLVKAIKAKRPECVDILLKAMAQSNALPEEILTVCLHTAIVHSTKAIVELLLNQENTHIQMNHLTTAIFEGKEDILHLLLERVTLSESQRAQLLTYALQTKHQSIIDFFLRTHEQVSMEHEETLSPLEAAIDAENISAITVLLQNKALDVKHKQAAIARAFKKGNGDILRLFDTLFKQEAEFAPLTGSLSERSIGQEAYQYYFLPELQLQDPINCQLAVAARHACPHFVRTYMAIMSSVADADAQESLKESMRRCQAQALLEALNGGNAELIGLLIHAHTYMTLIVPESALSVAFKSPFSSALDSVKTYLIQVDPYAAVIELHNAVIAGDYSKVEFLVTHEVPINAQGIEGKTALMLAAKCDHKIIFHYLLDNGASVQSVTPNNETALHIAVQNNMTEAVRELLLHNAQPHWVRNDGATPLSLAVFNGNREIMQLLYMYLAPYNDNSLFAFQLNGKNAGALVEQNGYCYVVTTVDNTPITVQLGDKVDGDIPMPLLYQCVCERNSNAVRMALALGCNIDQEYNGTRAIFQAISNGDNEIFFILLHAGASLSMNKQNRTPLGLAIYTNQPTMINALLPENFESSHFAQHGLSLRAPMAQDIPVAEIAVATKNTRLIRATADGLKAEGVNSSPQMTELLQKAVSEGTIALVMLLGRARVPLRDLRPIIENDKFQVNDNTLKQLVRFYPNAVVDYLTNRPTIEMTTRLIQAGAQVNRKNRSFGSTPLMHAVHSVNELLVTILLGAGAGSSIHEKDAAGETALMKLVRKTDAEGPVDNILDLLLNAGAADSINEKDFSGMTALLHAAKVGNSSAIKKLLAAGADKNISYRGQRAFAMIKNGIRDYHELRELLRTKAGRRQAQLKSSQSAASSAIAASSAPSASASATPHASSSSAFPASSIVPSHESSSASSLANEGIDQHASSSTSLSAAQNAGVSASASVSGAALAPSTLCPSARSQKRTYKNVDDDYCESESESNRRKHSDDDDDSYDDTGEAASSAMDYR